jgi:hypothetical protein
VKLDQEVECGQVTCMDVCSETQFEPSQINGTLGTGRLGLVCETGMT